MGTLEPVTQAPFRGPYFWSHMYKENKDMAKQISKMAKQVFAEHKVCQIADGPDMLSWLCRRGDMPVIEDAKEGRFTMGTYGFLVTMFPGGLVIRGDVGNGVLNQPLGQCDHRPGLWPKLSDLYQLSKDIPRYSRVTSVDRDMANLAIRKIVRWAKSPKNKSTVDHEALARFEGEHWASEADFCRTVYGFCGPDDVEAAKATLACETLNADFYWFLEALRLLKRLAP